MVGRWEAIGKGKADKAVHVRRPGLADVELIGSPSENDLAFPDWDVGDVGVIPREEHGVELASASDTGVRWHPSYL